ncbi:adenomatous polyposis coli protein, putative [Schistosoma mansoni]|uniref:adenomatous polyposis coli protein, putative n=1 Tax=Schistosoma mansoni TaxID=6183 RepID=UPI00022C85AB|nr:adenomatous polyposis coli protein, putative [Schistosoma mansoni]|eukprot:XP_018645050.1 adenomatous polyposis coli protein, putative [Schistosoma mansoni]
MHPCYNSSSMLSPPTVTTFHSSQSLSSSSQSSYYQSSTHDVSKPNSSEQYNLAHSRHHLYQNVILPSPSIQRFPNSSSNHFTHYSQSHIRTTTSYPSYDCYRNNSTHSQPNISNGLPIMGYPIALNSTKNYVVYEAKNGPTQSIMNNTDETLQYTNPSVIMNIQSQIPYSQYREVSRQPSRRPRPPPPPPPPRSGSWIETNFTETMDPSEIHTFHTFLLNWLTKTENIPVNMNTNMYVAQFSRRILTHLIRILYSDTVYEEETTTDGQTMRETEDEEYTMNALTNEKDGMNNEDNNNNNYLEYPSSFHPNTNEFNQSSESSTVCPVAEVAALVRLSFDSMHRNAICELENSLALRRYICMALTNLTYAAPENKSFICRRLTNLEALLAQLETGNEELKQVSASVLRNLSWRTDSRSKAALRRVCAAKRLTIAAMSAQRESTLRTTLSALWNLSAHCSQNKRAVCSVDGVFAFLLRMLHLQNPMQNLVIIENSGGILRNISTIIASHDDYRSILHQNNAYPILLELLRNPPSLTVVVNVCGTLWNLTCPSINNVNTIPISSDNNSNTTTNNNISSYNDRLLLLHLGALDLIEQLTQSKHDLIRTSSLAVYRNLIQTDKPVNQNHLIPSVCNSNQVNSQENQLSESSSPITTSMTINSHDQHSVSNEKNPCTNTDGRNSGGDTYYNVNNSAQTSAEQQQPTCKRRVSSRTSRLRFGLLSVVFEAESDDELDDDIDSDDVDETEDDEVEVENEVEGQTNEQNDCINEYNEKVKYEPNNNLCLYYRGGIPISDHSNYRDITVKTSSNRNSESLCDSQLMLSESTNRRHDLSDWYDEINCHGHHQVNHNVNTAVDTGVDDEQTRVYAEEGTPFPSNSANASSLDLNRSDEQFLTNKANNNFNTVNDVHISHNNSNDNDNIHSNAPILIYRNDPIPHVYAVEGTPSNCDSNLSHEDSINNSEVQLNTIGFSRPQKMNFLPHSDIVNEQEDNTYLPSPPEDISNLVTPLTSMNLEVEGDQCVTCHFPMPPPPASFPIVHKESELIDRESELFSSKQTPLIFSRGTSSCMSSLDLEVPFNGYQSSPESEYSSQQKSSNSRERISSELMSINRNHEDNGISSSSSNSSSSKRNCHFRNINHSQNCVGELYETDSCPDEEDVRLPFAEEGTPPPPKDDTENLNALYFHHSHSYKQSDMSSNLNNDCEVNEGVDDDDDDDEDDDNNDNNNHSQILQQCIASAMPSNIPYNVTGHKSSNINFNNSPSTGLLYNEPEDSLKTFAVEDTPFGTSTKTSSLNDLLTTEHKPLEDEEEGECGEGNELMVDSDMNFHSESPFNIKISNHTIKHTSNNLIKQCHTQNVTVSHGDGSSSTSSSLNGDNSSDLLSEVIQSAMPKSGQIRLSNFCSPIDQSSSNDDDCLQMYAVEGTPCVVGNKNLLSSSSSLRHDEISIHSALLPTTTDAMTSNMPLTLASPSSLSTVPYQQSNTTPPIPPLRTTSALTSIADPFTQVSGLTRPRATVAPMLQSKCHSLNSPIVSRSQNISEQSSKSCLNQNENGQQNNDSILLPNSSIPSSSSSPFQYTVGDKDDFKIPGHNLNNTTVTKLSDNNNNKTAQSFNRGAGTVHFLDHGSDDAQQQEEISYLNMNPVIMNNTITPKHNHASTGASITSTTNTTPVTVNCSSNSNNGSSIITNNQIKQIQMTSKVSCASFGADITNATNHNYSKLSPYYEPRRITSNFNKSSLPLNKTKSGLRAPSSIVSKSFVGMNNNNYSINKQDIDIIDVLDAKDISELLQQGAKTVVSDLMKPCDYINEKQHHSNNKLNNDTTITTTNSNNNNNSQPVSNASSLELLQKLTDLEQSISFDNDDSNTTTNTTTTATTTSNNSNKFNNKMIVTKSVESSNISPPSTCVTNQISSKATSISNIQSVKLHHPHQLSNRKLNNAKFTNHTNNNNNVYGIEKTVVSTIQNQCSSSKLTTMGNNQMLHGNKKTNPNNQNEVQPNLVNHASSSISSGNTVYKYKKNVIQPTTTMNSTHKTTINLDNKNTAQNSTKRTIKQRQQHQRIAMTEPPSVQGHSLASSRSVSAASSISNLKSISRLNNESNIQPPCNSITPKATSIQQISVESVYAALVKQNKSLMNQYSPNRTSNTTVNNNTNKLVSKTSNTGLYAKNTSSHRSFGTISRSNHSTERLTSVEEGIPLTTKLQQSKHNYSRHESNDCMPNALFCGNSTVDLNTKTPDGTLSKATESFGSGTISKNDNNTQASDVPKPIRGGRKSLIGRKTSPSTANMMNMPNNGIPVAVKPISAVKPTQHSLLNNNNNNNKDDNSKISIDKFKKSTTESPVESDINNKDEVKSSKDMNGYTKYEFEQNSRNHDKSIPGTNDCNINDKLENTPPGMWIVREDQDVVVSDFH